MSHHITVTRFFTKDLNGKSPYEVIEWEERTAKLTNFKGETIFEQQGVRVPKFWSVTATNITVSKYFYGKLGTPQRETSVEQLVRRITESITAAAIKLGYFGEDSLDSEIFCEELAFLLLNQYFAFNSPVWFNVGLQRLEPKATAGSWHWTTEYERPQVLFQKSGYSNPQCSACFIQSVDDSMEGIMRLATNEAMLFKFGSGTGTNFSALRSSKESVSGGGVASGPLSFMKGLDAFAGVIKSGGKTRRAAKMAILNADHPDILDFIDCKLKEDKKAQALMREGYDGSSGPDSEAYSSIFYQNANNSVRVSDEFMQQVETGSLLDWSLLAVTDKRRIQDVTASEVLRKIAQATWECGDPGLQFDDTINKWHTSPAQGRINASNPCSEYMFLDDSACNLGSFNLLKFLVGGVFEATAFQRAVTLATVAQDVLVDYSGYPTEEIAKNSHDYRPLGLGYANLGALLMAMGMAYDSNEGRALASVITAIMTGQAYATSAFMARVLRPIEEANFSLHEKHRNANSGCCPGWSANKRAFHSVIKQHQAALGLIDKDRAPAYLLNIAKQVWQEAVEEGKSHGYRNSQVTVLAPTGTIGFLMDCDTTGIEPELSLVKYKKLVGGGMLKIVNETVELALTKLGYTEPNLSHLIEYIDKHGTLEGSSLDPRYLPVFDTAFKPAEGTRSIHYMGHIQMMAATQPFLSGAISKTVNLPADATVDDIYDAYLQSWKLGLKAVAIYRDGSKSNQPVVVKKEDVKDVPIGGLCSQDSLITILEHLEPGSPKAELVKALQDTFGEYLMPVVVKAPVNEFAGPPLAVRHRLPDTRKALTHKFSIAGHDGYLTVGLYENGKPGEIFIAMAKEGSTLSGMMDSFALTFSIALQHGTPLETLVSKLAHTRFEPSGWTGNPDVGYAKSIMDYVARWLETQFLKPQQGKLFENVPLSSATVIEDSAPAPVNVAQAMSSMVSFGDSPACPECGAITVRSGSCYKCMECGSTTGCS